MAIRRQHPDDPSFARLAVIAVGLEFGLPDLTLAQDRTIPKNKQEVFARQVAAYLCPVSYTHLRAHETDSYLVCRLLLEKKNTC